MKSTSSCTTTILMIIDNQSQRASPKSVLFFVLIFSCLGSMVQVLYQLCATWYSGVLEYKIAGKWYRYSTTGWYGLWTMMIRDIGVLQYSSTILYTVHSCNCETKNKMEIFSQATSQRRYSCVFVDTTNKFRLCLLIDIRTWFQFWVPSLSNLCAPVFERDLRKTQRNAALYTQNTVVLLLICTRTTIFI